MWFTRSTGGNIARIWPTRAIAATSRVVKGGRPLGITVAPIGNLWFTIPSADEIATMQLRHIIVGRVARPFAAGWSWWHHAPGGGMVNPLRGRSGGRRKALMPNYVILMNWTDQGVRADRDTVGRREHADALAEKYGARIAHAYWTMGHYDIVSVIEAPDDESITAMMLELTAEGNVRTETLRAFDHDQMQAIVQRTG